MSRDQSIRRRLVRKTRVKQPLALSRRRWRRGILNDRAVTEIEKGLMFAEEQSSTLRAARGAQAVAVEAVVRANERARCAEERAASLHERVVILGGKTHDLQLDVDWLQGLNRQKCPAPTVLRERRPAASCDHAFHSP